ncbi:hypothetical protein FB451DRAFT_1390518 [Mycena latifolia]|nr:hypothetical protein FB451DRAFT_1390518 [Mycena latifolia]
MRLAPTLIVSSLAGGLLPFAAAHSPPTRSLARLHQHQPRGPLIDICLSIPGLAVDILSLLGVNVELCLCLKDLDIYLQTTDNVTLKNNALADVNALIGDAPNKGKCEPLPAHSHRGCTNANPCHYICDTGYMDRGGQCVCDSPGCGASAAARSIKSRGITTLEDAQAHCGKKTVCGVPHAKTDMAFECVDVTSNSESCGGCVTPHPFQSESALPTGTNCGHISSAHICENSKCVQKSRRGLLGITSTNPAVALGGSILGLNLDGTPSGASASTPALASMTPDLTGMIIAANALSSATLPSTGSVTSSTVQDTLNTVHAVLGSTPATLATDVDAAVNATQTLKTAMDGCGCDDTLGGLVQSVVDLLNHLLGLQKSCSGGVAPIDPSCLHVDADKVLCNLLGPAVQLGPIALCLLDLGALQNLVDGLGLNAACSAGPPPPVPPPPNSPPTCSVHDPSMAPGLTGVIAAANALSNATLPATGPVTSSTVNDALAPVHLVMGSTAATFPANLDAAVTATQTLKTAMDGCGCDDALGGLVQNVADLLDHLLGLQKSCSGGVAPIDPSCLHVDADKVLCNLLGGPAIQLGPIALCLLNLGALQDLVDGLGLNAACSAGPQPPVSPPPPVTPPPVTPPPLTPPPVTPPPVTPPPPPPATSDPDTVISLAGIVIHLVVTLNLAVDGAGPSCGGLIGTVNSLVKAIVGSPLVGEPGAILGRDLLDGLLGGGGSPAGDLLGLGGITNGLALSSLTDGLEPTLNGVTSGLALGPTLSGLTPTINSLLGLVNAPDATCSIGGLGGILNQLLGAVKQLLGGLGGLGDCGCEARVADAIAAAQAKALASLPAAPKKRVFRSRSRRGHVNFLRDADSSDLMPVLDEDMRVPDEDVKKPVDSAGIDLSAIDYSL